MSLILPKTKQEEDEFDYDGALIELTDPSRIRNNLKQGEAHYSSLSKAEWHSLRKRAKLDVYFLGHGILGYDRLSTNLHGSLAIWMAKTRRNWRFREVLLPRGHFKSTLFTKADSIRIVLPCDESINETEISWPDNLGTNCRLLICHEVADSAARFLFEITNHFCSNPLLMGLFPECVPSKTRQRINKYELELPRTKNWGEPTIDTMGVGGKNQGRHYNMIKADDLIGDKAANSLAEMQTAKDWFDNIQSFFSKFAEDKLDVCGTRWSSDDLYDHIHSRYGKELARYIRPVEETVERINPETKVKTFAKEPIFPEEFPSRALDILRKNKKIFSAQYQNDPDTGITEFNPSWIQRFEWQDESKTRLCVFGLNYKRYINVRDLDVCIIFDPATTGNGGYITVGMDEFRNIFILQAIQQTLLPNEQWEWMLTNYRRWQPRTVGIESVLFSELYKPWFEAEMRLLKMFFSITPLKTANKEKEARVRGLSAPLSNYQMFFCEDEELYSWNAEKDDSDIIYQVKKFGSIKEYHVLDALSYAPSLLRVGRSRTQLDALKKQAKDKMDKRDRFTGYSKINLKVGGY
jgi:hypothetical protein